MSDKVSSFGDSIIQKGQTHSMELILFPLLFLLLTGVIANNFSSSGIQTSPAEPTPTCQAVAICYVTNNNGCDANATANCNLNQVSSFSFLNPNSPFTFLLQGNILSFMSTALNQGETPNIIKSGYTICIPQNSTGFYQNQTGSQIHRFECLSLSSQGGNASVPAQFPNAGIPMNATSNGGNISNWDMTGCLLVKANYPCQLTNSRTHPGSSYQSWFGNTTLGAGSTFNAQMSFYAFYIKNGTTLSKSASCPIYLYTTPCSLIVPYLFAKAPTFTCPSTSSVYNININKTTYYCLLPTENQNSTSAQSLPNTFSALGFVFGVILFFIGLGFSITTALVGFQIDSQGTKLAQVFGIGITSWSFLSSEFSGWLLNLGFGLSTIVIVSLSAMFFFGLYWRIFDYN